MGTLFIEEIFVYLYPHVATLGVICLVNHLRSTLEYDTQLSGGIWSLQRWLIDISQESYQVKTAVSFQIVMETFKQNRLVDLWLPAKLCLIICFADSLLQVV